MALIKNLPEKSQSAIKDTDLLIIEDDTNTCQATFESIKGSIEDSLLSSFNALSNAGFHNSIYRGKNIQSYYEDGSLYTRISSGTFDDLYVGDYFDISITPGTSIISEDAQGNTFGATETVRVMLMGFDIYYNCGDTVISNTASNQHHAVCVPKNGFNAYLVMNETDSTSVDYASVGATAYYGSKMHQCYLTQIYLPALQDVFGDHILKSRELFATSVSTSAASAAGAGWTGSSNSWAWKDCYLRLMSEPEVYGTTVFSSSAYDVGNAKTQLPGFRLNPRNIQASKGGTGDGRTAFWLSAVASSSYFACCNYSGYAYANSTTSTWNVPRPRFLLG